MDENFDLVKSGYGYEEWLSENGHESLAKEMKQSVLEFIKNLEQQQSQKTIQLLAMDISPTDCDKTTVENRIVEICALYRDAKKVTDLYKNDFLLALNIGMPTNHGGDTD